MLESVQRHFMGLNGNSHPIGKIEDPLRMALRIFFPKPYSVQKDGPSRVLGKIFIRLPLIPVVEHVISIDDPSRGLGEKELRSRLMDSLRHLSTREKEVFILRDLEERTILETAGILGCSPVSVRVHLSAARKKIRDRLLRTSGRRGRTE